MIVTVIFYIQISWEKTEGGPQDPIAQYPPFHLGYIKSLNTEFCCLMMLPIFLAVTALLNKQVLYCQKAQPKVTVPQSLGWTWTKQWPENSATELCNIWPLLQLSEVVSVRLYVSLFKSLACLKDISLLQTAPMPVTLPYHLLLLNNY